MFANLMEEIVDFFNGQEWYEDARDMLQKTS